MCICALVYVCVCALMHVYAHVYMSLFASMCAYVCECVCVYVYVCVSFCVCMYVCAHALWIDQCPTMSASASHAVLLQITTVVWSLSEAACWVV